MEVEILVEKIDRLMDEIRAIRASQKEYLTVEEAAEYLCVSITTIYRQLKSIPHSKIGDRTIFKRSELDKWMERKKENTTDENSAKSRWNIR